MFGFDRHLLEAIFWGTPIPREEPPSSARPQGSVQPVKKPPCVVHPENAPALMHQHGFPKDFAFYEYVGPALEILTIPQGDGSTLRRPALVARMLHRCTMDADDAVVELEMLVSLRDLRHGKHPDADQTAILLTKYYEDKVPNKEPIQKPLRQARITTAAQYPSNDFFFKVNPPLTNEAFSPSHPQQ